MINTQPLAVAARSDTRQHGIVERLGISGGRLYPWGFGRGKMTIGMPARCAAVVMTALLLAVARAPAADAPEQIGKENVEAYKALLPQSVYDRVRSGDYVLPLVTVDPARFRA